MNLLSKKLWPLLAACLLPACQAGDMVFVRQAGADMPVLIRGNAQSNKVLLFVHGGPGGAAVPHYTESAFQTIEREAGVAYWDQRAAGSSQGNPAPETLTLAQYVRDLDAVVNVLQQRRPGARVYLMTHSWGGAIGAAYLADAARQSKIAGWIPVDASVSIPECNRLSREWAIQRAQEKAGSSEDPRWKEMLAWYAQHPVIGAEQQLKHFDNAKRLGAYRVDPAVGEAVHLGEVVWFSPHSIASELSNLSYTWQHFSLDELNQLDLSEQLKAITVPTLVMNGRQDGIVPAPAADNLYRQLATPASDKSLVMFERSAHHPMLEEPVDFARATLDFLSRAKAP